MVAQAWLSRTTPPAGMTMPLVVLPDWYLRANASREFLLAAPLTACMLHAPIFFHCKLQSTWSAEHLYAAHHLSHRPWRGTCSVPALGSDAVQEARRALQASTSGCRAPAVRKNLWRVSHAHALTCELTSCFSSQTTISRNCGVCNICCACTGQHCTCGINDFAMHVWGSIAPTDLLGKDLVPLRRAHVLHLALVVPHQVLAPQVLLVHVQLRLADPLPVLLRLCT